ISALAKTTAVSGFIDGIGGSTLVGSAAVEGFAGTNHAGVLGSGNPGVAGVSDSGEGMLGVTTSGDAVKGYSQSGDGVYGSSASAAGVYGTSQGSHGLWGQASGSGFGVEGDSVNGVGVLGASTHGAGVEGESSGDDGVFGTTTANGFSGTYGRTTASGYGMFGEADGTNQGAAVGGNAANGGKAAHFYGGDVYIDNNLHVTKQIFAGTKDFKIDHPLDPADEYLVHASIESSEMLNVYSGNAVLDGHGLATIALPDWMEAENGDFRYTLTAIGSSQPGLYVAQKIRDHRFVVAGGAPGGEISWQVTGVRRDRWALANPLVVEEKKPAGERGLYLHPEAYGLPREKGISWAEDPRNPGRATHPQW
ncbi:MAG TPA: hypothetical protein VG777_10050, partial [Thermoanaerobaculia bacterium]|nr:hypothetical protein [Thermoanaerobaculia bacterium]